MEHGRRPFRERKNQRISKAVRKEDLGRREHNVVLPDTKNLLAVRLVRIGRVVLQMNHALRPARGARRVHPERHLVPMRVTGSKLRFLRSSPFFETQKFQLLRRRAGASADDHEALKTRPRHIRVTKERNMLLGRDGNSRRTVRSVVRDELRPRKRIHQHRNKTCANRPKDGRRVLGTVLEHAQHTLTSQQAKRLESVTYACRQLAKLGIGDLAVFTENRDLATPTCRQVVPQDLGAVIVLRDGEANLARTGRIPRDRVLNDLELTHARVLE